MTRNLVGRNGHRDSEGRLHQPRRRRVIYVLGNCLVLDALDHFVHNKNGNEKPLARLDGNAEAILDFNIQLDGIENAMNHVFELDSVDVEKARTWR